MDQQEALLDFSSMFKTKKMPPRPALRVKDNKEEQPVEVITNIIPTSVTITQEEMRMRRCLDIRRWYCLSRPQY